MTRASYWLFFSIVLLLVTALHLRAQAVDEPWEVPLATVLEKLHSADAGQRREAARALGNYRQSAACQALVAAAHDDDPTVRAQVVGTLGSVDSATAVHAIVTALHDDFELVRTQAIKSLNDNPNHAALDAWLTMLQDPRSPYHIEAAEALARHGDVRAIAPLIAMLGNGNADVRRAAVEALGQFSDPPSVPGRLTALYGRLQDPDPGIRHAALHSLSRLHDRSTSLDKIRPLLHDTDAEVRVEAMRTLRACNATGVFPDILSLARDPAAVVRREVAVQIGDGTDVDTLAVLFRLAKDSAEEVRLAVAKSIRARTLQPSPALASAQREDIVQYTLAALHDPSQNVVAEVIVMAGSLAGRRATRPLVELLDGIDWQKPGGDRCLSAVYATLKGLNDPATEELLAAKLADADTAHRRKLLQALNVLGTPRAVALLAEALVKEKSSAVKMEFMRWMRSPSAVPLLLSWSTDTDQQIRTASVEHLGGCGQQGIQALLVLLVGKNDELARTAQMTLENCTDPGLGELLVAALQRPEPRVRLVGAARLASWQDRRAQPVLAELLADADPATRLGAAEWLARWADPRAVEPLAALLAVKDAQLARRAALALGRYGDRRAIPTLSALLDVRGEEETQLIFEGLLRSADDEATALVVSHLSSLLKPEDLPEFTRLALICEMDDLLLDQQRPLLRSLMNAIESQGIANPTPFEEALRDTRPEVRAAALFILEQLHDPAEFPLFAAALQDTNALVRLTAVRALNEEARSLPLLIGLLHDPDDSVRAAACYGLGQLGDRRAVDPLLEALKHGNSGAIDALGNIGDVRAAATLFAIASGQGDVQARSSALSGLGNVARELPALPAVEMQRYADALLAMVRDEQSPLRGAAMEALGNFHDSRSVQLLLAIIDKCRKAPASRANADLLTSAISGLATCGDVRIIDPMISVLAWGISGGDERSYLDAPTMAALKQFPDDPRVRQALGKYDFTQRRDIRPLPELLAEYVKNADNSSMVRLQDDEQVDWVGRGGPAELARRLQQPENIPIVEKALLPLLSNAQSQTRFAALCLLQYAQDPSLVPLVLPLLNDVDPRVCANALLALGRWRAKDTVGVVLPALNAVDPDCRFAAAHALGQFSDPAAVPALMQALADREWLVRYEAVKSLGMLHDARATEALIAIMQHPGHAPPTGAFDAYYGELTHALSHPRESISIPAAAAIALGEIGDSRAVPALITALERGVLDERVAAARALGMLKDRRAVPALIDAVAHFGGTARQAPSQALKAITGENYGMDVGRWLDWWGKPDH